MLRELQLVCPRLSFVDTLVEIWERANRRLFLFYDSAASAYFAFLRFNAQVRPLTVTFRLSRGSVAAPHFLFRIRLRP